MLMGAVCPLRRSQRLSCRTNRLKKECRVLLEVTLRRQVNASGRCWLKPSSFGKADFSLMKICSVNLGQERMLDAGKSSAKTGIFKLPVEGSARMTRRGLKGDLVANKKHHGGPDQAVYLYTLPDYAWWAETLGQEMPPGAFGENLTLTDLESASLNIGDRLITDSVTLEVTAPRIPCMTLARRMNDAGFVKKYIAAERPGLYCRVLQEGSVQAGDTIRLERYSGATVSVLELFHSFYAPELTEAAIGRFLAAPIARRARAHIERKREKLAALPKK